MSDVIKSYYSEAIEKITMEFNQKNVHLSRKGKIVSKFVISAIDEFCKQSNEFAQAVVQSKGTIAQCIEASVNDKSSDNDRGNEGISDALVAINAAKFYFSTANVNVTMKIDLGDGGYSGNEPDQDETSSGNVLSIDFEKLFS